MLLLLRLVVRLVLPLCAVLVPLAAPGLASADVGPKPDVTVGIYFEGQQLPYGAFSAAILSCEPSAGLTPPYASWGMPAMPALAQLDLSDPSGCRWGYPNVPVSVRAAEEGGVRFSYMVPTRFRLAIHLPASGQTYLTPPVDRHTLRAKFRVDLAADGTARIEPAAQPFWESDWRFDLSLIALPITLAIELLIVLLWTRRLDLPARPALGAGLFANILSLPTVWLVVMAISTLMGGPAAFMALAAMEVLVIPFESLFYWRSGKVRLGSALALAAVANLASLGFGAIVH
mgnify:CR=1 FL=1